MEHEELTRQIIGCAYRVFNTMGPGFLESVYENCMLIELRKLGLHVANQHPIQVFYQGRSSATSRRICSLKVLSSSS